MIPPESKIVFKGVIFDVYQWQQKMYDGRFETFERVRRPDTVQVIAVVGDKLMVIDDEQPDRGVEPTIPGGRVDHGEAALAAAKREFLEETGYESNNWKPFKVYHPFQKIEWDIHYFIARDCKKLQKPTPDHGGERIRARLVTFEEFLDISTSERFGAGEFTADMLRLRLDPPALAAFKKWLLHET